MNLFPNHPLVWDLMWQPTLVLAIGLVMARLLERRPSLAHAAVAGSLLAATAAPMLSLLVRANGWGLLAARPAPEVAEIAFVRAVRGLDHAAAALEPAHVVAGVWALASALVLVRVAGSFVAGRGFAGEPAPEWIRARVRAAAGAQGLRRRVEAFVSDTSGPCVHAWRRAPVITLPAAWADEWPAGADAVLAHELAHLQRRDHLWRVATEACVAVHAINPLAWIARRSSRHLAELACDAAALRRASPLDYAQTLHDLCAQRVPAAALGAGRPTARRVRRILQTDLSRDRVAVAAVLALSGLLAAASAGAAALQRAPTSIDLAALPAAPGDVHLTFEGDIGLSTTELDLGVTSSGGNATGWFYLANFGEEPIRATEIEINCACTTVAGFEPREIEPGEIVPMLITMHADIGRGQTKTKTIVFHFEEGGDVALPVTLRTRR